MNTKLTLALVALITHSAFAAIPAVLPEFKNEKQLAEWRDEMAAKHEGATTGTEDHAFYTGKPYIESTASYAFKYRSYNPDLARWTSEDPSGFPDGGNNTIYVNNSVLSALDYLGLATKWVTGSFTMTATWKEIKTLTTGTQFSISFPLSVEVSVSPGTSWDKWGQESSSKTAGEYAEQATAPSGWTWVNDPNTIVHVPNPTIGTKTYGKEYDQQIGTSTITVLGLVVSSEPIIATLKDGSLNATYQWKRLAEE